MMRNLVWLALAFGPVALAQDNDDPWSQPSDSSDSDSSDSDSSDSDSSDKEGGDQEGDTPPPVVDDPWAPPGTTPEPAPAEPVPTIDDPVPTDEDPMPAGPDPAAADTAAEVPLAPADETTTTDMTEGTDAESGTADSEAVVDDPVEAPVAERTPVDPASLPGGNVPTGLRIQPYGAGSGVDVGQAFVVGRNGGTNQTTLRGRFASGKWGAQLALPFVVHRMPRQPRDTGLGNLQLDLWRQIGDGSKGYTAIGAELHTNIGAKAYTWVHDADDIWPGTGLDLVLQARRGDEKLTTLWRLAVGLRGGQDYAPWANTYLTIEGAAGIDYTLADRIGLVGETSIAYWDLSPFDASALVRADVSPGLRLRGGFVFPLGVWTGISRVDSDFRGLRETTLMMDLSLAL